MAHVSPSTPSFPRSAWERGVSGLVTFVFLVMSSPAHAQDKLPDARKVLYDALVTQAAEQLEARKKEVANLKTPADIKQRQERLRAEFRKSLGPLPPKSPLHAIAVGALKGDGFRVEKVIFDSRPQHQITANFYLPAGQGPFPGVIVPCGHSANGKANEPYQRMGIALARNGIAALCYDPIGQGERYQMLDAKGQPLTKGGVHEHIQIGIGAWLVGQSTATYRIWDGMRALDYLESRPEIDAKKLGCTGNSGGGTLTAYLMVLDDRIVAAAPSCYITSLEKLLTTIGPQDAEQVIVGQIAFGMNHADFLTMRAPRPTLVCVATRDFFNIDGAWDSFREAKLLYGKLGHGERMSLFEFDDVHGFSRPRREAALRWMRRWLLGKDDAAVEGEFSHFTDAELQCTRSGQVLADFKGVSAFGLSMRESDRLAPARAEFVKLPAAKQAELIQGVLRMKQPQTDAAKFERDAWRQFNPAGKYMAVAIPEYVPGGAEPTPLTKKYLATYEARLRGIGGFARDAKPASYNPEYKNAMMGLLLDRPLLGQRVAELRAGLEHRPSRRVHLIGEGITGLVALHAAALDANVEEVIVEGTILSWADVVRTPDSVGQIQNVVPGVLGVYDLPELIASLAPRKVTIVNPVDARLQPMSQQAAEEVLAAARKAYVAKGAADNLRLQTRK